MDSKEFTKVDTTTNWLVIFKAMICDLVDAYVKMSVVVSNIKIVDTTCTDLVDITYSDLGNVSIRPSTR